VCFIQSSGLTSVSRPHHSNTVTTGSLLQHYYCLLQNEVCTRMAEPRDVTDEPLQVFLMRSPVLQGVRGEMIMRAAFCIHRIMLHIRLEFQKTRITSALHTHICNPLTNYHTTACSFTEYRKWVKPQKDHESSRAHVTKHKRRFFYT
jgi:hypothetical protein